MSVADFVKSAFPVFVRLLENAFTSTLDQAAAADLLADRLRLRASAQRKLDARRGA